LEKGDRICIVSTGYMTHAALEVKKKLLEDKIKIGVIDVFMLKPFNEYLFFQSIKRYKTIITIEEAFLKKGGLDSIVSKVITDHEAQITLRSAGFEDKDIKEAMAEIKKNFAKETSLGPTLVGSFIYPNDPDAQRRVMTDSFMRINDFLQKLGLKSEKAE
ncbi:MAG: transketolase C-terminal domain-containing protein, partial [Candidatus Hodarchaeota archaeon]